MPQQNFNHNPYPQKIALKVMVLKYGNLLLGKTNKPAAKWDLPGGVMHPEENLQLAVTREVEKESGWLINNIRLFKINVYSDPLAEEDKSFEPVFVADGVRQSDNVEPAIKELKWFPLTALPEENELEAEHLETIRELAALLHEGKTLDLDRLPPLFPRHKAKKAGTLMLPVQ